MRDVKRTAAVVALALVAGLANVVLLAVGGYERSGPTLLLLAIATLAVGWSFVGAGLAARRSRPEPAVGWLMVAVGLAWFLRGIGFVRSPAAFTLVSAVGDLDQALLAHLLVVFPSGRIASGLQRAVVVLGYVLLVPGSVALLLAWDPAAAGCATCPANLLLQPGLAGYGPDAAGLLNAATLVLVALVAGVVALRWRGASPPLRRALAPVAVVGAVLLLFFAAQQGLALLGRSAAPADLALGEVSGSVLLLLWPVGFLVGLTRLRLDRSRVGALAIELGGGEDGATPERVQQALGRALHDPSVRLAYWLADREGYVDVDGRPVALPDTHEVTLLRRDGEPFAALLHDPALADQPELVDAAVATARLSLDNERLQAELRAQLAQVRASRARLVEFADAERRRVERNLHDGAQQRLLTALLGLRRARACLDSSPAAAALDEAGEQLTLALDELRDLARGLHPAILSNAGLAPALDELVRRSPVPATLDAAPGPRLPAPVEETAYFVVSEALANVARHAGAATVAVSAVVRDGGLHVEVADDGAGGADPAGGSGLRGLADRVAALDGALAVDSPPGGGTRVTASLPLDAAR